jgi:RNA polymerase sigma-70 factor, ECF subfamily
MLHAAVLASTPVLPSSTVERDEFLVAAARAGSSTAFTELFGYYSKKLYRRAFAITRNREDAEDVVQDTFLRAYANLNQFEGRSVFSSWLTRIAINSALMVLRKRRRRLELPFELPADSNNPDNTAVYEFSDNRPGPDEIHSYQQEYQHALRSIRRLPRIMRTVAEMRMLGEYSAEEVTRELGISESAVKARLFRARTRLVASRTAALQLQ